MTGLPIRIHRSVDIGVRPDDRSFLAGVVRLVRDGIEHRHDLTVDVDRVRHVDIAAEHPADAFAHDALAVSRRAVEEHRAARRDGRPELVEHLGLDDEMSKRARDTLAEHVARLRPERAHVRVVLRDRDRGGADVPARFEIANGPIAAGVGQRISIAGGAHARRALHLHQQLDAQMFEQRLEDGVRQANPVGQIHAARFAPVQRLDDQRRQRVARQPAVLYGQRLFGCQHVGGLELLRDRDAHR